MYGYSCARRAFSFFILTLALAVAGTGAVAAELSRPTFDPLREKAPMNDSGFRIIARGDAAVPPLTPREADIILPNMTEACFLLDIPYGEDADHTRRVQARAHALCTGRLRNVLITSCSFPDGQTGLVCVGEEDFAYEHERLSLACHGSGDVFASVFSGLMLIRDDIRRCACAAADFTCDCIRHSMQCADHRWYGVDYEAMLPQLVKRLENF